MTMQGVITRMREDVPLLAKHRDETAELYHTVRGLFADYVGMRSELGRETVLDRLRPELGRLDDSLAGLFASVERLQELNAGYTRKLGPRAPKEEDPRQMTLDLGEAGK